MANRNSTSEPLFVTFHDNGQPALARVYAYNENPAGRWTEYAMSRCPMGCKIYYDANTGQFALMHNWNYGCRNYGSNG